MTLVELLVTIIIFGLVGAVVIGAIIVTNRVLLRTEARFDSVTEAQRALERVVVDLRSAQVLVEGGPRDLQVLVWREDALGVGACELKRWWVLGGELSVSTGRYPDGTTCRTALQTTPPSAQTQPVMRDFAGSGAIFEYLGRGTTGSIAAPGTDATALSEVGRIVVTVTNNDAENPVRFSTEADLRNVR